MNRIKIKHTVNTSGLASKNEINRTKLLYVFIIPLTNGTSSVHFRISSFNWDTHPGGEQMNKNRASKAFF
jgi:hypothetical protein